MTYTGTFSQLRNGHLQGFFYGYFYPYLAAVMRMRFGRVVLLVSTKSSSIRTFCWSPHPPPTGRLREVFMEWSAHLSGRAFLLLVSIARVFMQSKASVLG
jgi:hypothetical protein